MKNLVLIVAALSLSSCAAMTQQYRETYCNYDGAYKLGANDYEQKGKMDPGSLYPCEGDSRKEAERGYREGYAMGKGSAPITINIGQGNPGTSKSCLEAYGQKKCGYDCKEAFGRVACGKNPGDNCVVAFGQIRCGQNCRESYGQIQCD